MRIPNPLPSLQEEVPVAFQVSAAFRALPSVATWYRRWPLGPWRPQPPEPPITPQAPGARRRPECLNAGLRKLWRQRGDDLAVRGEPGRGAGGPFGRGGSFGGGSGCSRVCGAAAGATIGPPEEAAGAAEVGCNVGVGLR